jgi:hypothetical protein
MSATLTPLTGAELLSQLGFLHVPGVPVVSGRAYLFVALRPRPTLRHFDPEVVRYWTCRTGRGVREDLDWATPIPLVTRFSWGLISIADRLGVTNDFVAFGGELEVDRQTETKVIVFSSEAPILARGGHSQDWDPWSDEVAAFLARLRAAAGDRQLEEQLDSLTPVARYAAFVGAGLARYRASTALSRWHPATHALLERERRRLQAEAPDDWASGTTLRITD